MNPHRRRRWAAALAGALASLAIVATAVSQSASGFDLSWRAPFGGGGSSGAAYVAQGVIGQPVSGRSAGGGYQVDSGFLGGGAVKFKRVLPLLSRDGAQ